MYHDYISRKPKPLKTNYNFTEHKETLLDIVYKMVQPNAENVYEQYHIYKDLFSDFTCQIVSLDKRLKEKHVVFDLSDNFIDEYKEIMNTIEDCIICVKATLEMITLLPLPMSY